jgi:hypothetical protein
MTLTHRDSAALCQIAYMDNLRYFALKNNTLQKMAAKILEDRDRVIRKGGKPEYDLGQWGDFSTAEHYALLEEIAKGEKGDYRNLSNLVFKAYENDSGKTDFVACAFGDKINVQNTYMSFRGSMGNQFGDSLAKEILGKASGSWIANYHRFLNGLPRHFDKVEAFVRAHKGEGQTFVTGLSKGAADAAAACARIEGVTGWGINGPGIAQTLTYDEQARLVKSRYTMFMNEHDLVCLVPWHIEKTVTVKHKDYFGHGRSISGPRAGHNSQTLAYDERGGFIPTGKSKEAEKIEASLKEIYKENLVNGNKLGLTVYGLEFVKSALETTEKAFQLLEEGKKAEFEAGERISAATGEAIIDTANKAFSLPDQATDFDNEVKAGDPIRKQIENVIKKAIEMGGSINDANTEGAVDGIYNIYNQQQGFRQGNKQEPDYKSVSAAEINKTLYATWQPCKEWYLDREKERDELKRKPTRTDEEMRSWALNQHLTTGERDAEETRNDLHEKREDLEKYYSDFKAKGQKEGYYRFYSKHLPEFMKSKGQKAHELEKTSLFQRHDELKEKEESNMAACERREAKLNDPEFMKKVEQSYRELKTEKQDRYDRIKLLEGEMKMVKSRMAEINRLAKYLPESIGDKEVAIKGAPKDINNLLSQSKEIKSQTAFAVLEKQPDYNFETGRPHEKEYQQQIQRDIERSM